jgi:ABC-type branched-subunit amino acid transport system substrate-binding protein
MRQECSMKRICAVILGVLMILTFTSKAAAESKKELVFGLIGHMTGAYAAGQAGILEGHLDCVKTLDQQNYIPGAKLTAIWIDGGTDAAKSLAGLKKMLANEPNPVVIHGESTPIGLALKTTFVKAKVPTVEAGSDDKMGEQPTWTFSPPCPNVNFAGAWVDYYLANVWKDSSRKPRFAFLTWDNAWGRSPITPKVKAYIESKGVEIVGEEFIPMVPTDVSAQLLRLKEKKVDFTYGGFYATALAPVLKDADKLGLIDQITFGVGYASTPEALIKYVGDLTRNTWVVAPSFPEAVVVNENRAPLIVKAYQDGGYSKFPLVIYAHGFAMTSIMVEAARMAAEKVGVGKVDGPAVYDALKRMKNFTGLGFFAPVSFDTGRWFGQDQCVLIRMTDSKIVFKGMIKAPDLTVTY